MHAYKVLFVVILSRNDTSRQICDVHYRLIISWMGLLSCKFLALFHCLFFKDGRNYPTWTCSCILYNSYHFEGFNTTEVDCTCSKSNYFNWCPSHLLVKVIVSTVLLFNSLGYCSWVFVLLKQSQNTLSWPNI